MAMPREDVPQSRHPLSVRQSAHNATATVGSGGLVPYKRGSRVEQILVELQAAHERAIHCQEHHVEPRSTVVIASPQLNAWSWRASREMTDIRLRSRMASSHFIRCSELLSSIFLRGAENECLKLRDKNNQLLSGTGGRRIGALPHLCFTASLVMPPRTGIVLLNKS